MIDSVWLHVGAFLLMALTAFLIWDRTWTIIAALVLLAIVIEAAQSVIPDRTVSILDALGSSVGIVLGWVSRRIYRRWLASKDDSKHSVRSGEDSENIKSGDA